MAWTLVFVPALCYFLGTRMSQAGVRFGRSYTLGQPIPTTDASHNLCKIFYCSSQGHAIQYGVYEVQATGLQDVVASTWRKDSELGRGYLLMSDAADKGHVWRWEVGGGPIAIGRTLHLEDSGCRSPACLERSSPKGSGGLAVDFFNHEEYREGLLVVAEWGEQRIVRLEENGARTPLVVQVPDLCTGNGTVRVQEPRSLLYTPTGDLIFTEYQAACNKAAVMRLSYAVHVSALKSLQESRQAHQWTEVTEDTGHPEIVLETSGAIGGLALAPTLRSICVTTIEDNSLLLRQILLTSDDDDEDYLHQKEWFEKWKVFNETKYVPTGKPGPIAISKEGHVFVATEDAILVIVPAQGVVLGALGIAGVGYPTSLTLGEDGFLYITSQQSLYRIGIQEKALQVPTNIVRKIPKNM